MGVGTGSSQKNRRISFPFIPLLLSLGQHGDVDGGPESCAGRGMYGAQAARLAAASASLLHVIPTWLGIQQNWMDLLARFYSQAG